MQIKLLVDGGEMKPGPIVGQQLGPVGINIGEVISKVNQVTSEFKGMKVPIVLDINSKTKAFKIEVNSPPASELLKKEIGVEKGSGDHKKQSAGNASIEQVIKVAKIKYPNMLSKDFKSAVKSIAGSCMSAGILVENKKAVQVQELIDQGEFDKEIKEKKTITSPEKLASLKSFFEDLHKKQEAAIKAEEEAEKAAEEAKTTAAKPGAVAGATASAVPAVAGAVAGATPSAGKAEAKPAGKKEEKKK